MSQTQHKEVHRFSDFADPNNHSLMDGDKVSMQNVLNKEIKIINFRVKNTKFPDSKTDHYLTIQFEDDEGNRKVVFTGSSVLTDQLERHKDHLPFYATIVKTGKFFSLS